MAFSGDAILLALAFKRRRLQGWEDAAVARISGLHKRRAPRLPRTRSLYHAGQPLDPKGGMWLRRHKNVYFPTLCFALFVGDYEPFASASDLIAEQIA